GPLEPPARAHERHGRIHSLLAVVGGVGLDDGSTGCPSVVDRALDECLRDPLLAIAGAHADAPQGPGGQVVDMGDLARVGEGVQLGAWCNASPPRDLAVAVGEHPGRLLTGTECAHLLGALRPDERAVLLRTESPRETPADGCVGPLGPEHERDVVEVVRWPYLD